MINATEKKNQNLELIEEGIQTWNEKNILDNTSQLRCVREDQLHLHP